MQVDRRSLLGAGLMSALIAAPAMSSWSAAAASPASTRIKRLAWSGVVIERGDTALFIDAVAPDPERGWVGPEPSTAAARTFALVTHHHGDHCDLKTLQRVLGERGYLVAHEDVARLVDGRGVKLQTARLYEPVILSRTGGEFVVFCVPANDGFGSPQVSWVVDDGKHRLLHCGDTAWHGGWWDIARAYGPFDVAFLPINGFRQTQGRYDPVLNPMSLTPEQAADAASLLKAATVVPIHYGSLADASYVEERQAVERFAAAANRHGIRLNVLQPGEGMTL